MNLLTERTCIFSPCRTYRYELRIIWDASIKPQMFIGLNPSTADETQDDPTIRRCIDYAQRWSRGGLVMVNACAYRATDPKVMLAYTEDQIGPENTIAYLERIAAGCAGKPIAAWGNNASKVSATRAKIVPSFAPLSRHDELRKFMGPLDCLKLNQDGSPAHPLYLKAALLPKPFNYEAAEGPTF